MTEYSVILAVRDSQPTSEGIKVTTEMVRVEGDSHRVVDGRLIIYLGDNRVDLFEPGEWVGWATRSD